MIDLHAPARGCPCSKGQARLRRRFAATIAAGQISPVTARHSVQGDQLGRAKKLAQVMPFATSAPAVTLWVAPRRQPIPGRPFILRHRPTAIPSDHERPKAQSISGRFKAYRGPRQCAVPQLAGQRSGPPLDRAIGAALLALVTKRKKRCPTALQERAAVKGAAAPDTERELCRWRWRQRRKGGRQIKTEATGPCLVNAGWRARV